MTLAEALSQTTVRRHARRPSWHAEQGLAVCMVTGIVYFVDHTKPLAMPHAHNGNRWVPRFEDIVATDWEMFATDTLLPGGVWAAL